jgi:hypothetical protein
MRVTVAPPIFTSVMVSVIVVLPDSRTPGTDRLSAAASWQADNEKPSMRGRRRLVWSASDDQAAAL